MRSFKSTGSHDGFTKHTMRNCILVCLRSANGSKFAKYYLTRVSDIFRI